MNAPELVDGKVELPELEICPKELMHGYPDCDCDLVGGDSSCTKTPTLDELHEKYSPLKQRERQLLAALASIAELKRQLAESEREIERLKAVVEGIEKCALEDINEAL